MAGLFLNCVLPGCGNPVDCIGEACKHCQTEFGDLLRRGGDLLTQAQIDERDHAVRSTYEVRRPTTC